MDVATAYGESVERMSRMIVLVNMSTKDTMKELDITAQYVWDVNENTVELARNIEFLLGQ